MMNLKMTSNFSWTKLLKFITHDKRFGKFVGKEIGEKIIKDSKDRIINNRVKPATLPITLRKRQGRKFPKSIGGDTTLYDTGKLLNSIKLSKSEQSGDYNFLRGLNPIELGDADYGAFHQLGLGSHKKRPFIDISAENYEGVSKKLMSIISRTWRKRIPK